MVNERLQTSTVCLLIRLLGVAGKRFDDVFFWMVLICMIVNYEVEFMRLLGMGMFVLVGWHSFLSRCDRDFQYLTINGVDHRVHP